MQMKLQERKHANASELFTRNLRWFEYLEIMRFQFEIEKLSEIFRISIVMLSFVMSYWTKKFNRKIMGKLLIYNIRAQLCFI